MPSIHIYLTFDGNCEEAFSMYQSIFGGDYDSISRFGEMPPQEDMPPIPEDQLEKIMHVSLPIGDSSVLMGSDTGGEWGKTHQPGNNFSISIGADSRDQADQYFAQLADGGQVIMALNDTFWGSYFGMLTDRFGISWMVSFDASDKKKP